VAIRQQRLARTLIPSQLEAVEPQSPSIPVISEGDTWLIAGGLSEVGQAIAKGLAAQAKINLVLTGRSPLPPRQDWQLLQAQNAPTAQRIATIEALEQLGANVMYLPVDITNLEQMEQSIATIKAQFGELNGVIQAAGVQDTQTFKLQDKNPETINSVFAPKVQGTMILDRVTRSEPLKYFVLLSSATASAIEWCANLSDYAAANMFLDNYASYRRAQKAVGKSLALNFSIWDETGMAKIGGADLVAVAKARGVDVLEPAKAVRSLLDALETYPDPVVHIINFIADRTAVADSPPEVVPVMPHQGLLTAGKSQTISAVVWQILSQYLPQAELDGSQTFSELGLDSLGGIETIRKISNLFNVELSPTILFGHPTPDALIAYLEELYQQIEIETARESLLVLEKSQHLAGDPNPATGSQDIAIIGIGCKVPGADNLEQFWQLLDQEQSRISDVPTERWISDDYFDAQGVDAHKTYCKQGGFVDRPYDFDALFFGISPREAIAMDPQQRLFLEVTWQALQQAGYGGRSRPKEVGVFVGCGQNNYVDRFINAGYYELMLQKLAANQALSNLTAEQQLQLGDILKQVLQPSEMLPEIAAGNELNEIAARVSHCLDLSGPSLGINTACSSSLVALHLACESLRKGESLMAIAGGVNLNLSPTPFVALSRVGALSPTGTCYPFDSRANGIIIGDGVGAVLLKPLAAAVRDGDFIHAVIKGSAINNDGYSQGMTAPNPRGQAQAIRNAYLNSGIDPETISYIETHGTGTALGDPIEIEGMTQAFRHFTTNSGFCGIGSVKSAIGHSLSAAGIVSLIKVVLAMQHGKLPGTLGFENPNPHINFEQTPFYVVGQAGKTWQDAERPLRAGINGFGFGGTNCHVILEQAPAETDSTTASAFVYPYLLCLKGRNQDSLRQVARDLSLHLSQYPEVSELQVCATLNQAQRELAYKAAVVISDRGQLLATLTAIAQDHQPPVPVYFHNCNPKRSTPLYLLLDGTSLFTAADVTLLRHRFAAFETAYQQCEQAFAQVISPTKSQDFPQLDGEIGSFAQQYAFGNLLMSLAVMPTSIHAAGVGVLVGACLGGMFDVEQAMTLLVRLAAKQTVQSITAVVNANTATASWNGALITDQGTFQYPSQFDAQQLATLIQSSPSLQLQQVRSKHTQVGVYGYLGDSTTLTAQIDSIEEPNLWLELTSQLPIVERVLTLLARLSVFGVWFDSKGLFPAAMQSIPLPTYPFERKTYKPPVLDSSWIATPAELAIAVKFPADSEQTLATATDVPLPALAQLPSLSNQSRESSYLALTNELRKLKF
jgi:acyl transferase domain-containing protein/NAD(P)-dependent dehydrogenase (short-subunit alcohol dehydrogenase family)/acyl carrier protein